MIGDIKIKLADEKVLIEDGKLKTDGVIFLTIDGRRNSYKIKSKTDKILFLKRIHASVLRGYMNAEAKKRLIKNTTLLWSTYEQQYKNENKMPKKTALQKITTRAKEIRKKQPGKKWITAVKQASAEYRQTGGSNKEYDEKRTAKPPGKRRSKSGNVYTERRKNRSDVPGTMAGIMSEAKKKVIGNMLVCQVQIIKASTKADKKKWRKQYNIYLKQYRAINKI